MSLIACASATWGSRDVAQADVADQPLAPEVGQHHHLLGDRPLLGTMARHHHAVVDDVERVQTQVAEVVLRPASDWAKDPGLARCRNS